MSKYVECEVEFKDIESLIIALLTTWKESEINVHLDKTQESLAFKLRKKYPQLNVTRDGLQYLEGYNGDKRKEQANVIIPRKYVGAASNDIGFLVTKKESKSYISNFDQDTYTKTWQNTLKQEYAVSMCKKTCYRKGWKFVEKREKGQVQFEIQVPEGE